MVKFSTISIVLFFGLVFSCSENKTVVQKVETIHPYSDFEIPSQVIFANEEISLDDIDVQERYERELIVNAYYHSSTFFLIKRSTRWFPTIERVLKEEGIPEDFKYLALAESGLAQVKSYAGAAGFWQFLSPTAKDYNLEVSKTVDERYHIEKSTRAACKYLMNAKKDLGSWPLAAAAYNRGKRGVQVNLEKQYVSNYFDLNLNSETARYFFRILALKEIIENPNKYNFDIKRTYEPYKTVKVTINESIKDLSLWSKNKGFNKKILKKLNPWLISNKLKVKDGKSYVILLPAKGSDLKVYSDTNGE